MVPRRHLLLGSVALATLPTARAEPARAEGPARYKAIAFDGFPVIDPRPVALRAEALFPGRGARLMEAWRTRQFEYTWLRTLSGRYADFWQVTQDALVVAAAASQLDLTPDLRDGLMRTFLELKAWPDVAPALGALKARGVRMAFLANPTVEMLEAPMRNSGLEGLLEAPLSTDRVQAYKPDPRAYQMGLDAFGLKREEIVFAASVRPSGSTVRTCRSRRWALRRMRSVRAWPTWWRSSWASGGHSRGNHRPVAGQHLSLVARRRRGTILRTPHDGALARSLSVPETAPSWQSVHLARSSRRDLENVR